MEILKTAADNGCTPLNYMEVKDVITVDSQIKGVIAIDNEDE